LILRDLVELGAVDVRLQASQYIRRQRVAGSPEEVQNAAWNRYVLVLARGVDNDPGTDRERDSRDIQTEVDVQVGSESGRIDDDNAQGVDIQQRGVRGANVGPDAQRRRGKEFEAAAINVQEKRAQHLDDGVAGDLDRHIACEFDIDQERAEVEPHRIGRVA